MWSKRLGLSQYVSSMLPGATFRQKRESSCMHSLRSSPHGLPFTSAGDQCGCVLHAEAVCLQLRVTTVRACNADRRACAGMPGLHAQWHGVRLARIQHI